MKNEKCLYWLTGLTYGNTMLMSYQLYVWEHCLFPHFRWFYCIKKQNIDLHILLWFSVCNPNKANRRTPYSYFHWCYIRWNETLNNNIASSYLLLFLLMKQINVFKLCERTYFLLMLYKCLKVSFIFINTYEYWWNSFVLGFLKKEVRTCSKLPPDFKLVKMTL